MCTHYTHRKRSQRQPRRSQRQPRRSQRQPRRSPSPSLASPSPQPHPPRAEMSLRHHQGKRARKVRAVCVCVCVKRPHAHRCGQPRPHSWPPLQQDQEPRHRIQNTRARLFWTLSFPCMSHSCGQPRLRCAAPSPQQDQTHTHTHTHHICRCGQPGPRGAPALPQQDQEP